MSKQERKAYLYLLKELMGDCPTVLLSAFFDGAILGARPFIAVYLTGLLIDAVYAGESPKRMAFYALLGTGIVLIISVIESFVVKHLNQNMEYMYERQAGPLSRKSMQMDFEYLEDAKVHEMRESVTGFFPRFGLIGMVCDSVLHFTDVVFTVIAAVCIVVPNLIQGIQISHASSWSVLFAVMFIAVVLLLNGINIKVLNFYNDKLQKLYDMEKAPIDTRKKFYLDLYAKADSQKDIRMCEQEKLIGSEISLLIQKANEAKKRFVQKVVTRSSLSELCSSCSTILVYLFVGIYGFLGIISIGSVVSFAASIRRVADSMFKLGEVLGDIKYESAFAVKYQEFMNLNQRKHEGTIPLEKRRDDKFSVEFDHVSFKYPGSDTYVLQDLCLRFVVGEKLAIVGKNGSGKTTFIKLLCRLYDVTEGCIKVNGIDIRKYDYKEYCNLFGVVFQDFTMFDFPLGEAISCSEELDEERATDALTRAGLSERVRELPQGLATYIGKGFDESGVNFSGGEKQKLAIARAIYKNAPFVIMDEPTAALDPEAEAEVFAGFDKMVGRKTAIYISHRLASCKFCEDILVFDKGRVVQHGTHEELEAQDGLYRQLWNAQAQYYA